MPVLTSELRAIVLDQLAAQEIELPSWAFGNSGTRFKVFPQPGVARDPFEKIEDAAQVHALPGWHRGSRCTSRADRV